MIIRDILNFPSLKNSKLLSGQNYLDRTITGVNILEHTDVETWAREGIVILSSLFAIRELDYFETKNFFKKLHELKIAALIVKKDRLVSLISSDIINLCKQYAIVLIEIDSKTKYEEITLDILSPIIYENSNQLKKYYDMHNYFTKLSLKLITLEQILNEISKILSNDLTLISENNDIFSTNKALENFEIISNTNFSLDFPSNYRLNRFEVTYKDTNIKSSIIIVKIPFIKETSYELIIYENKTKLTKENLIIVENAINLLQVELLKKYYLKLGQFLNNNNIVSDIFYNKISDNYSLNLALERLGINKFTYYRVLKIKFYCKDEFNYLDFFIPLSKYIRKNLKFMHIPFAFYENSDRMTILFNVKQGNDLPIKQIDDIIKEATLLKKQTDIYYNWTLSCEVDIKNVNNAYNQATNMHKFFKKGVSDYLIYDKLGSLKLFLNIDNKEELLSYIPKKYFEFYKKEPDLFHTLVIFLNSNQNYKTTSQTLYLHPKSIKYRISKIKKLLNFDFNNSDEILEFQITSRILEILEK